jgi:hypothetical protein
MDQGILSYAKKPDALFLIDIISDGIAKSHE